MARIHNFNPGPSALPLEVLERMKADLPDYKGTGMSVLEISHRSPEFTEINETVESLLRELMGIPDNHRVILMGGGASLQFAMIPMNLMQPGRSADYVLTGTWARKAFKEGQVAGEARVAATTETEGVFPRIPKPEEIDLDPNACYVHLTSNNTISGTQWHTYPDTGSVPLVVDMSSDYLCRPIDVSKFGLIYGGAQKGLGPAGVTAIVIRDEVLESCRDDIPIYLRYGTHAGKSSLYNTPPAFAVYGVKLVLEWVKEQGGVPELERRNRRKAELLYGLLDGNPDFFRAPIEKESRSLMNIVFRLPTEDLEKQVIAEAKEAGFGGLKGHRSVGGMRVSAYNYVPVESVELLVGFLEEFARKHG
jgi:phosphoserine aminotransferase